MAEAAASTTADDGLVKFNIKSSSDANKPWTLELPPTTTVADLKTTLSGSEYADIPVERIRLIYSGRVLKDPDTLGGVNIKTGHTVHLVRGAASNARQTPANQGGASAPSTGTPPPAAAHVPTNIAAGTGNNPLASLTGARYAGMHGLPGADMFGPDGGMGPPPDPESLLRMMDNPMFLSQMNEAMNNPAVIEMMTNSPMLRNNPIARQMLENPEFRRILMNPETIRMQLNMQRSMDAQGGGSNGFPAPGVTNTTPQNPGTGETGGAQTGTTSPPPNPFAMFGAPPANTNNSTGTTSPPPNPFAMFGNPGAAGSNQNPFAALFGGAGNNPFGQPQGSTGQGDSTQTPSGQTPADPTAQMRAIMQQLAQANQGGAGNDPANDLLAQMFNNRPAEPQAPADTRPPEEVYADQLRQLNDMGFHDFDRNVQALRRSGGNVHGAVESLLNG